MKHSDQAVRNAVMQTAVQHMFRQPRVVTHMITVALQAENASAG